MAHLEVSGFTSGVHIEMTNNQPTVSSKEVALRFQKKHKHILEEIRRIEALTPKDFYEPNFRPVTYQDSKGEGRPAFMLTRDAFSLLAMGFTGKAAIQWKLKYIAAFNALEAAAVAHTRTLALEEGRLAGRQEALATRRRMAPQYRVLINKALKYRRMGLELREIGKLMDCSHQKIFYMLKDAAIMGKGV